MNKLFYTLVLLLIISGCSLLDTHGIMDDLFTVQGGVYDIDENPIESVNVRVVSIEASEDHESLSHVGNEYYTDVLGEFSVSLICNTTWKESIFSNEKNYINYVSSVTLEFSKDGYDTQVKEFISTDMESKYFEVDIILSK